MLCAHDTTRGTLVFNTRDQREGTGKEIEDDTATMMGLHDENIQIINRGLGRAKLERRGAMPDGCVPSKVHMCGAATQSGITHGRRGWEQESLHSHQAYAHYRAVSFCMRSNPSTPGTLLGLNYKVTPDPSSTAHTMGANRKKFQVLFFSKFHDFWATVVFLC